MHPANKCFNLITKLSRSQFTQRFFFSIFFARRKTENKQLLIFKESQVFISAWKIKIKEKRFRPVSEHSCLVALFARGPFAFRFLFAQRNFSFFYFSRERQRTVCLLRSDLKFY